MIKNGTSLFLQNGIFLDIWLYQSTSFMEVLLEYMME